MSIYDLSEHLQHKLRAELKPGESITWAGQPNAVRIMKQSLMLWYFAIPWILFSVFLIVTTSDIVGKFFFLLCLLIGLFVLVLPIFSRMKARSTIYAITNHRAISIEGTKSVTVNSYLASDITDLKRIEQQDGSGDLLLRNDYIQDKEGKQRVIPRLFYAVDNVRNIEKLVANLIRMNNA